MHDQRIDLDNGACFVQTLRGEQSSHLLVCGGKSVLIDCHSANLSRWIAHHDLPQPELILHTHVQPEHCREANTFPNARILVPEGLEELAGDREAYERKAHTAWDHPEDWPITMGREAYGVGGSVTHLPPEVPLKVTGTIKPGDLIPIGHLQLRAVALPGHGLNAMGYLLEDAREQLATARAIALFCGDLLRDPARLVNVYDLEINYGGTSLAAMPAVLRDAAALGAEVFFPATGPALINGAHQALELADKIDAYFSALNWTSGSFTPAPQSDYPKVGRYLRLHEGIYQINNFGNCILLIDGHGRGLLIDPGPCDYDNPNRVADFIADFERLERECGLKTIERILITHFHGDHYDYAPHILARYPGCRVVAWDLVARVVESPWDYPYACKLPWYKAGVEHVRVDDFTYRNQPYFWNEIRIDSDHLPGHCHAHAVYFLTFNGLRLAITGDSMQSRGGSDSIGFIICNDSVPDEHSGCLAACQVLLGRPVDFNIGGHGSHFADCRPVYEENLRRMERALPKLRALVHAGDMASAFRRPWFPRMEPL